MANIKSAIKRIQIAERNRLRNKSYKSAIKTLMKHCFTAVSEYAANPTPDRMEAIEQRIASAYSKIDKAVKKGVLHPNNGARKKARLVRVFRRQAGIIVPAPAVVDSAPAPIPSPTQTLPSVAESPTSLVDEVSASITPDVSTPDLSTQESKAVDVITDTPAMADIEGSDGEPAIAEDAAVENAIAEDAAVEDAAAEDESDSVDAVSTDDDA